MARRACIVGVGETRYARWGQITEASEHQLALEAILAAVADAGLAVDEVDGLSSFADDRNQAIFLAAELGLPELKVGLMAWLPGGGGACASVANAAMAVETGQADVVVAYRSLCQGEFHRFGQGPGARRGAGERAPAFRKASSLLEEQVAFTMPFGMFNAPIAYAMVLQRHMHLYGTTSEQLGAVAVRTRAHAQRNPRAVMQAPMTIEDHQASRMVSEPFHLFDCCLETDGACAVVVTSEDRARDLRTRAVSILASAQGSPHRYGHGQYVNVNVADELYASGGSELMARRLWSKAGLAPGNVDAAMIYDHFSGLVLLHLEDFGFCDRGEGGPCFAESALPINTHGGSLSEAYIHGLNHVVEGVRQLRGESTDQVDGCETVLVTSAAGVPASALVLARGDAP